MILYLSWTRRLNPYPQCPRDAIGHSRRMWSMRMKSKDPHPLPESASSSSLSSSTRRLSLTDDVNLTHTFLPHVYIFLSSTDEKTLPYWGKPRRGWWRLREIRIGRVKAAVEVNVGRTTTTALRGIVYQGIRGSSLSRRTASPRLTPIGRKYFHKRVGRESEAKVKAKRMWETSMRE